MSFSATVERGEGAAETEIEIEVFYSMAPAEPDVGIMSAFCDELWAECDGKKIALTDAEGEAFCERAAEEAADAYDD